MYSKFCNAPFHFGWVVLSFKGGITVREEKYFLAIVWGPSYLMGSPYTSNLYVCFVRPPARPRIPSLLGGSPEHGPDTF